MYPISPLNARLIYVSADDAEDFFECGRACHDLEDGILEKYGLEAKNEEIQAFAQRYVADQFGQYGMPAPEGDELARVAGRLLSDRDQVKRMRDSIVDQKIMRHFITLLEPKEQRMGYEEFVNLARTS